MHNVERMNDVKEDIRKQLERKGIKLSDHESEIVTNRWRYGQTLRENLHKAKLNEADIALRYIPGGEKSE